MNGYKVDIPTVEDAGASVSTSAAAIAAHAATLNRGSHVLRTEWTGMASDAFGGAESNWQDEIQGMVTSGAQLAAALQQSAEAYDRADEAVARAWSI